MSGVKVAANFTRWNAAGDGGCCTVHTGSTRILHIVLVVHALGNMATAGSRSRVVVALRADDASVCMDHGWELTRAQRHSTIH